MDLAVTRRDPNTGRVSFVSGSNPDKISGISKLVQKCVLLVLRSFESDIFRPMSGGNYLSFIGTSFGSHNSQYLANKMVANVSAVEEQIIADQGSEISLTDDEKLLSLVVTDLSVIPEETKIEVQIKITNLSGNTQSIIIPALGA